MASSWAPLPAAASGSGPAAGQVEPEPLEVDRSQAKVAEAIEQVEKAPDDRVALPPGGMDGDVDPSALSDPSVVEDLDGDGVVAPPREPEAEVVVEPSEPMVTPPERGPGNEEDEPGGGAAPEDAMGELVEKARDLDLGELDPGDEVTEMRTEESRTFVEEDGTFRTEISTEPLHVESVGGDLVPIDTSLAGARDERWRPEASRAAVSFSASAADTALASIGFDGGEQLSWALEGAADVPGVQQDEDAIHYDDVFDAVDLELAATARGVKETLVLADASAPTVYEFPLSLVGLEAVPDGAYGSIRLVDPETGANVGVIPSAWARDASVGPGGEVPDPKPVAFELAEKDGQPLLRMTLDATWLQDPARVFPVRIDPSAGDYAASGDSWIGSNIPSTNNSTDVILKTGGGCSPSNSNCQSVTHRSYFAKWNLGLLSGTAILEAQYAALNIYSFGSCNPAAGDLRGFGVYRVLQNWNSTTITFNNRPSHSTPAIGAHIIAHGREDLGCPDAWVYTPMTTMVQRWVDGTYPNYGITGRVADSDAYTDEYTYKHFASREANGDGGQILSVGWTQYRAAYALGAVDNELSANSVGHMDIRVTNKSFLNWNASGAGPYRLSYHVYRRDSQGNWDLYDWDGRRTDLPHDMQNESVWLEAAVDPLPPGTYQLRWEMVRENVTWFSQVATHADLTPLVVQITVPNQPPYIEEASPGGPVDTRTPTLEVVGRNPDGWPAGGLEYNFRICEDAAMTQACVVTGWQTANTWAPPGLSWAKTYYWRTSLRETGSGGVTTAANWKVMIAPTVVQPRLEKHFGSDPYAPLHGGVNPSVGNYTASSTDTSIAGAGLPIELSRTYNSMDTRVGAFGSGWSTFLDLAATAEGADEVLVSYPDGRQERFAKNADGTWASGTGITSKLRDGTGGGWELVRSDQTVYVFDASGEVTAIRDAWGNQLTFHRTAGQIDYVDNDIADRKLHLTWGAEGPGGVNVVTEARTDPVTVDGQLQPGLEWNYSYDGDGRLAEVCAPQAAPACTGYTYYSSGTGAAGKLHRIIEPAGQAADRDSVQLHYSTDGTVDWLENGTDDRWTFNDRDDQTEGTYHPISGWRAASTTVGAGATITVDVTAGPVPTTGVQAVVVDISAGHPAADGWFAAYPSGTAEPTPAASTMTYAANDARSTLHTVAVGDDGKISLTNHGAASVPVTFDVVGWYGKTGVTGGNVFVPLPSKRILDTRESGQGPALTAGSPRTVQITGEGGVPTDGVTAVVYNLQAVAPSGDTTLVSYAAGTAAPNVSTLSSLAGKITDNLQITPLGNDGEITVSTAAGTVHVTVNIVGYFADPAIHDGNVFRPVTNARLLDSREPDAQWPFAWPAGGKRPIVMAGDAGIPLRGVSAVVGDVQGLWPTGDNSMRMSPSGEEADGTTYVARKNLAVGNHFYTGLGENGAADLTSITRASDVVVDVVGYFTPMPRTVLAADPRGGAMEYRFDELGRLVGRTDQAGYSHVYGYDDAGFLWLNADETGAWKMYTYDSEGKVLSERTAQWDDDPMLHEVWGSTKNFSYLDDAANPARDGKLEWVSDGRSANRDDTAYRTTYSYNTLGQLLTVRGPTVVGAPGGVGVTRTYTTASTPAAGGGNAPAGLIETETDAAGLVTTYRYDSLGDLREVVHPSTVPNSRSDAFAYDELGRVVTATEHSTAFPAGATTTKVYDGLGRVVNQVAPEFTNPVTGTHRRETTTEYTPNGQLGKVTVTSTSGGQSRWVEYTYDDADRLVGTVDSAGRDAIRTYDEAGNLATSRGYDDVTALYDYDPRNLLTTVSIDDVVDDPVDAPGVTRPDPVVLASYGYDAAGRRLIEIDATGKVVHHRWRADDAVEMTAITNLHDTDPDTGLPVAGERTLLTTGNRFDAIGNPIEQFEPSDTTFSDGFTGSSLGTGWTTTGTWSVTSGELRATTAGLASRTAGADGQVGVTIGATEAALPAFRISNSANYHRVNWVMWGPDPIGLTLERVVNGTATVLDANILPPVLPGDGDRVEAVFVGNRIWVLVNGAVYLDGFDSTNENATGVGVVATAATRAVSSFRYDAYRRTANTFDSYGRQVTSTFDPGGVDLKTTTQLTPDGRPDLVTRSRATNPTVTQTTDLAYDAAGNLDYVDEATESGANRTDHTVDDRGLTTAIQSPEGGLTSYGYDALGRLTSVQEPARTVERYGQAPAPGTRPTTTSGYNVFDEIDVQTDPAGETTTTWYDTRGLPALVVEPSYTPPGGTPQTRTVQPTFDNAGRMVSITDEAGETTEFVYNTFGLAVGRKDPAVGTEPRGIWRTRYDDAGRVVERVNPTGAVVRPRWDDLDRQTGTEVVVRQPELASHVSAVSYGNAGGTLRNRSAAGIVDTATYDIAGRRLTTTDGDGNTTTYGYDELSRPTLVTAPDNRAVRTVYNRTDDVTAEQSYGPTGTLLGSTGYVWDGDHRLRQVKTPRAVAEGYTSTTLGYDPAGQITTRTTAVAAGQDIIETWGYDALGQVTRYTDGRTNETWQTYNAMDLPEDVIAPAAGPHTAEADRRWRTTYDLVGRPTTAAAPGGVSVATSYDELGRPNQLTGTGADVATETRTFDWDAAGRILSATSPGGTQEFAYDDRALLLSATGPAGASSFEYDADGRTTERTDSSGTTALTYDNRGLPATMTSSLSGTVSFDFDTVGRPTLVDYGTTERHYTYDDTWGRLETDALTTTGTATPLYQVDYGYNLDGDITTKTIAGSGVPASGANAYTYDRASRIASWTGPGRGIQSYQWDGASNRTQAGATTAVYDEQNRLASTSGPDGQVTNTWRANGTLQQQETGTTAGQIALVVADPASPTAADTALRDHLLAGGAAVTLVDDAAAVPTGSDVIVVAPSVDPGTLADKYKSVAVPVVTLSASSWQVTGLTTAPPSTAAATSGHVASPGHPIAAGETGTVTLLGSSDTIASVPAASLGAGATTVWEASSSSTDAVVAVYDAGAATPGGPAAERRVAIGYSAGAVTKLNTDGWAVFDAAVTWADADPAPGTITFGFDAYEQLREIGDSAGTTSYDYDAIGRRLSSPTGDLTYAGMSIRPSADGTNRYQPGPLGTIGVDDLTGGGGTWGHTDAHTDLVGRFTDSATTLTSPQAFSPWGQNLGTNGPASPLGYQQERPDLPGGLVPMGAREYNPATGTFITHDPITDPRVPNGYSYTPANPLGATDPTGFETCGCPGSYEDLARKIDEAIEGYKEKFRDTYTKGTISPSSPLFKAVAAAAAGAAGSWIYNQYRGSNAYRRATGTDGWTHSLRGNPGRGDPRRPRDPTDSGGGGGPGSAGGAASGAPPYLPPPPPPPPPPWITYGYPPAVLEPIAHTTLISALLAGGDAVANYPGRYQTDPATGQRVDTGNASAANLADAIVDALTIEVPDSPGIIEDAIDGAGVGNQDAAVSIPASTAPPGGGMDADTAAETGQCAQALGQAVSGDENLAAAALDCLPLIPNLGPADNAAPPTRAPSGGSETFYRGMSNAEYEELANTGRLSPRGESFVTQDLGYVEQLAARHPGTYERIVEFEMQTGTRQALINQGARDQVISQTVDDAGLGGLPIIQKGDPNAVHIKGERGTINYGLRPGSADEFNCRILGFCTISGGG